MADPFALLRTVYGGSSFKMETPEVSEGRSGRFKLAVPPDRSHGLSMLSPSWGDHSSLPPKGADALARRGTAFLFALPYPVICGEVAPAAIAMGITGRVEARIYPPFDPYAFGPQGRFLWETVPNLGPGALPGFERIEFPNYELPVKDGRSVCRGLRVDLYVDESIDEKPIPAENAVLGDPRPLVAHVMRLLRHRTRQWWLGMGEGGRRGSLVAAYPIAGDGSVHGDWISYVELPRFYEIPTAVTSETWMQLRDDLAAAFDPPVADGFLLDAYHFTATRDVETAALALANSVEIARTVGFETAMAAQGHELSDLTSYLCTRGDLGRQQWHLPTHLDRVAMDLFGRSFAEEEPAAWKCIERLWKTRGNVAHGKRATFEENNKYTRVSSDQVSQWFDPVRALFAWLEELSS